jgi:hypothetical protein
LRKSYFVKNRHATKYAFYYYYLPSLTCLKAALLLAQAQLFYLKKIRLAQAQWSGKAVNIKKLKVSLN